MSVSRPFAFRVWNSAREETGSAGPPVRVPHAFGEMHEPGVDLATLHAREQARERGAAEEAIGPTRGSAIRSSKTSLSTFRIRTPSLSGFGAAPWIAVSPPSSAPTSAYLTISPRRPSPRFRRARPPGSRSGGELGGAVGDPAPPHW